MKTRDRKELHSKSKEELQKMLQDKKNELSAAQLEHTQFKLKNTRSLFTMRKDIARILTALQQTKEVTDGTSA